MNAEVLCECSDYSTRIGEPDYHNSKPSLEPSPELQTFPFKLGWTQGVLIPCLLNIWGVMLFLRIAWVVAQAWIGLTLVIIAMSTTVCIITTLSLSAICTNGHVKGGGVYYLVSRALGAPFGAPVGVIFALANAVAASMNTIGFCESLNTLLREWNCKIIDNDVNDIRIVGTITIFLLCIVCAIGMDWESKAQNFLIVVILLAICNYFVGVLIGPLNDKERAQGFVGFSVEVVKSNWNQDFRYAEGTDQNFISIFAIYFPAVTGVQSGANICGDLKDPASAIPKGTLLAVLISTLIYIIMALLSGSAALRDASGNTSHVGDFDKLASCKPNCDYGLHNNYKIMQLMSGWGLLVYFGCWAATLSTALTNLLAVPRLIQALGRDRIYPGLIFFAKAYGKHGEPYRGYVLTFFISAAFLLIADLNTIAPLITNFYLASYALINFCTFHADLVQHINWRPQYHWFNKWVSLLGFIGSLAIMIIINWMTALLTLFIFLSLYLVVHYRSPRANWGSSSEAMRYRDIVSFLVSQTKYEESIKSYNPQILLLTGPPYMRPKLLEMAHIITKHSFMIAADIVPRVLPFNDRLIRCKSGQDWLNKNSYRAFYALLDGQDIEHGVSALLEITGLGKLKPNILMIGYHNEWHTETPKEVADYVRMLQIGVDHRKALIIMRSNEPLDRQDSNTNKKVENMSLNIRIDAWWLYDDGGHNILISFLIAKRCLKEKITLRIYVVTKPNVEDAKRKTEEQLHRYRIEYEELFIIKTINESPQETTWLTFNQIVSQFYERDPQTDAKMPVEDLKRLHLKTSRNLRLRELLMEHSAQSALVVVSMPLPREDVPAPIYMAWIDVLSQGLPKVLFIRGNRESVMAV